MNAIIMAGGYGNRLKPLTDTAPKPMLNVCNKPVIDYCVAQLNWYGIKDIVFSLGYKPEAIIEWATGYNGITAHFSVEDTPLGTLGGVNAAARHLGDTFVVLSGDGINDINLNAMLNRHLATKAEVTIAVKMVDDPSLYGLAQLSDDGFIDGFIEKPHGVTTPAYVNCGTYIVSKKALEYIQSENCDFARDLFPLLVSRRKIAYYQHYGYWQDIGDFISYYNANFDMLTPFYVRPYNIFDDKLRSEFVKGSQSLISRSASVFGMVLKSVIGHGAKVSVGSVLENCVVLPNAKIEGRYKDCIIGDGICINVFDGLNVSKNPNFRRDSLDIR